MIATNDDYFGGIERFAVAAVGHGAPCVVASVRRGVGSTHALVHKLELPLAADWLPEESFCKRRSSGWRHAGVLKTQLMVHILRAGFDCFMVDSDWRSTNGFYEPLNQLQTSDIDIAAPADPPRLGGQLLNIGLLWIRNKPEMLRVVERVANRTYGAWDQLIFNQEVNFAEDLVCCASYHLLQTAHRHAPPGSDLGSRTKKAKASQEQCLDDRAQYPIALPPPDGITDGVFPHWQTRGYNDAGDNRCTSRCLDCRRI
jgi:hypothetical protein